MTSSRRIFLKTLGITAGGAAVLHLIDGPFSLLGRIEAAPLGVSDFKALADVAFNHAKELGCSYADMSFHGYRTGSVSLGNNSRRSLGATSDEPNQVSTVIESANFRFRMRVVHSGAWGFIDGPSVRNAEIARVTSRAVALARANAMTAQRQVVLPPVAVFKERCFPRQHEGHLEALISKQMADKLAGDDGAIAFRTEEMFCASSNGARSRTTRLLLL